MLGGSARCPRSPQDLEKRGEYGEGDWLDGDSLPFAPSAPMVTCVGALVGVRTSYSVTLVNFGTANLDGLRVTYQRLRREAFGRMRKTCVAGLRCY